MKEHPFSRVIALVIGVISSIYACKSDASITNIIEKDHTLAVRRGFMTIVNELQTNYLNGFLWLVVTAILITVTTLLLVELVLKLLITLKKRQLEEIINGE